MDIVALQRMVPPDTHGDENTLHPRLPSQFDDALAAATLARWMGIAQGPELAAVVPNIGKFAQTGPGLPRLEAPSSARPATANAARCDSSAMRTPAR